MDGIPAHVELDNRIKLVSGSSQLRTYRALNMFAAGNRDKKALIDLEKVSGDTEIVEVPRSIEANLYGSIPEFDYPAIETIKDDIYLINLRNINRKVFEDNSENLSKARGSYLIIVTVKMLQ